MHLQDLRVLKDVPSDKRIGFVLFGYLLFAFLDLLNIIHFGVFVWVRTILFLFYKLLKQDSILGGKACVIFCVLLVDLVDYLREIISFLFCKGVLELLFLIIGKLGPQLRNRLLLKLIVCGSYVGSLLLKVGSYFRFRVLVDFVSFLSYSVVEFYYLYDLLLLFPFEMLIVRLLHVLNSLSKTRVPVVFYRVISPSY